MYIVLFSYICIVYCFVQRVGSRPAVGTRKRKLSVFSTDQPPPSTNSASKHCKSASNTNEIITADDNEHDDYDTSEANDSRAAGGTGDNGGLACDVGGNFDYSGIDAGNLSGEESDEMDINFY